VTPFWFGLVCQGLVQEASSKQCLLGQVPVAHACNPSCSGSKDQEDDGLMPAGANSSQDPISKTPITKKGLVEWLKVKALSLSPSTEK
jgi:hypothetical protein